MRTPTDTGIVTIETAFDGTSTVMVCASVLDGVPIEVRAVHFRRPDVRIDDGVALLSSGSITHSRSPVAVFADDDGVVHVKAASSEGRLMGHLRSQGLA